MKTLRYFNLLAVMVLLASFVGAQPAAAQEPTCGGQGELTPDCEQPSGEVDAEAGAFFRMHFSKTLKGGYVAHGVGMRNMGYGTIYIGDVPEGSNVSAAFLYWAVIGPAQMTGFYYNKGKINGSIITGTLIGSATNPCWGSVPIWAYRADVKSKMYKGGNGTYKLSAFASGSTDGSDPWGTAISPLLEGATLVIVYGNNNQPLTTVQLYNGATTTWGSELHLAMAGLNAFEPTGLAYTTFVGADGQSASEPGSKFFSTGLGTVGWDGGDLNGAGGTYSQGNLWDTMTVDVQSLLDPPEPDFWVTTQGGPDCLTWVAQAVAYSSGNQDTDGDKLKDGWELNGYAGVDLPGMGADPLHKDLFVEADYMKDGSHDQLPAKAQLDDIVAVFNNAPVSNPDGTTGIHIHIDTGGASNGKSPGTYAAYNLGGGNSITHQEHLGADTPGCSSYDWSQFQALKNSNFSSARASIFHYMIFAHDLAPCFGSVSGISRNGSTDALFIKGATDFIVSMGSWGSQGTSTEREGTFTHEFGHNLGLRHGGNDHANYKPNYLSIMNYFFQTSGVYRDGGWGHYDYSRFLLGNLNENALNEFNGLGALAASYGTKWYCGTGGGVWTDTTAGTNIDWNCNESLQASVSVDINNSGGKSTLGTQDNWANITFGGGGVIGSGASLSGLALPELGITTWVDELTYEQDQLINGIR